MCYTKTRSVNFQTFLNFDNKKEVKSTNITAKMNHAESRVVTILITARVGCYNFKF